MFYNIEWNYMCEQSYAHAEMAQNGNLIFQALIFAAVVPTYKQFSHFLICLWKKISPPCSVSERQFLRIVSWYN